MTNSYTLTKEAVEQEFMNQNQELEDLQESLTIRAYTGQSSVKLVTVNFKLILLLK